MSRAREMRAARRSAQFAKFRITELNLVPLVDTFVSIVFFALTTATVSEMTQLVPGVKLPETKTGAPTLQQLTLGIGNQVTLDRLPLMNTADAASSVSNVPGQPLVIPQLYTALKARADSVRRDGRIPADSAIPAKLAIQGDKSMRYDLLSRMIQTARWAGFKNITLQVNRLGDASGAPAPGAQPNAGGGVPR
ncbi:MAG: biopolymer transporter ExbD [Gemmatimonadota bacterium]|nr:biopolymer transporter ExbD [Gemmatimonadota bacterium]